MAATDEQADWRAAQDHDSAAFSRLFDRHRDVVFRQALRLVSQRAVAEEVASAAFFELWRSRDAVVLVDGSVRPWLLATAANLARIGHRTRVRRESFLRASSPRSSARRSLRRGSGSSPAST